MCFKLAHLAFKNVRSNSSGVLIFVYYEVKLMIKSLSQNFYFSYSPFGSFVLYTYFYFIKSVTSHGRLLVYGLAVLFMTYLSVYDAG